MMMPSVPFDLIIRHDLGREKKRTKIDFIGELVTAHDRGEDLLPKLRKATHSYEPDSRDDIERLLDLIDGNLHKLPTKLRPAITSTKFKYFEQMTVLSTMRPSKIEDLVDSCYDDICKMVLNFLKGYDLPRIGVKNNFMEWWGPNFDVDTEDEIELAIRLCPRIFLKMDSTKFLGTTMFVNLTHQVESLHFVPFLLDIHPSFRKSVDIPKFVAHLLDNDTDFNPATPERDGDSFDLVLHMKESDLIKQSHMKKIVSNFLYHSSQGDAWTKRSYEFVERRIRLLTEWDPTILRPKKKTSCDTEPDDGVNFLLQCIAYNHSDCYDHFGCYIERDIRFYKLILELGTRYYPEEVLGLAFDGSNFEAACKKFREERATEVIQDIIVDALEETEHKKRSLQNLIFYAATNESIKPDGLYALVRIVSDISCHV